MLCTGTNCDPLCVCVTAQVTAIRFNRQQQLSAFVSNWLRRNYLDLVSLELWVGLSVLAPTVFSSAGGKVSCTPCDFEIMFE